MPFISMIPEASKLAQGQARLCPPVSATKYTGASGSLTERAAGVDDTKRGKRNKYA